MLICVLGHRGFVRQLDARYEGFNTLREVGFGRVEIDATDAL